MRFLTYPGTLLLVVLVSTKQVIFVFLQYFILVRFFFVIIGTYQILHWVYSRIVPREGKKLQRSYQYQSVVLSQRLASTIVNPQSRECQKLKRLSTRQSLEYQKLNWLSTPEYLEYQKLKWLSTREYMEYQKLKWLEYARVPGVPRAEMPWVLASTWSTKSRNDLSTREYLGYEKLEWLFPVWWVRTFVQCLVK